ncbi:MAG: hypothetical protein IRZ08_11240 [Frankia sp.]|nr:hypothetical protein [Frankia sp.]
MAASTVVATAGLAVLGPASPASAGGFPTRECADGARADFPAPLLPGEDGPQRALRLTGGGFYAAVGGYWPPTTIVGCLASPDWRHPLVKMNWTGCDLGAVPFQIPDHIPSAVEDTAAAPWGTFLPPGWYRLGTSDSPEWVTVCWYLFDPSGNAVPT